MTTRKKWLPVVSDYCTGCGMCVDACPHSCLELVWDFAKLLKSEDCISDGTCMEACPSEVIEMEWIRASGDEQVGLWCDRPHQTPPAPLGWFGALFQRRSASTD